MGPVHIFNAFLSVMLISVIGVAILYFLKSPWFKGFAGEILVHISAKIHLDKDKYHVLRNVTLSTADETAQIDHIIVSEYGVFVIETKNMNGRIYGGARKKTWTQKKFMHAWEFQNPLHQNTNHVETLKKLLELTDQQIFSIVVFVGSSTFKTEMPENVINGPRLIKTIKSKGQQVILRTDVPMIVSKIEAERLMPSKEATKAVIEPGKEIEKQNANYRPRCGHPMVERKANNGINRGKKILGRIKSPEYRGTAATLAEDEVVGMGGDKDFVFTDSWGNRTWREDEQPEFTN